MLRKRSVKRKESFLPWLASRAELQDKVRVGQMKAMPLPLPAQLNMAATRRTVGYSMTSSRLELRIVYVLASIA